MAPVHDHPHCSDATLSVLVKTIRETAIAIQCVSETVLHCVDALLPRSSSTSTASSVRPRKNSGAGDAPFLSNPDDAAVYDEQDIPTADVNQMNAWRERIRNRRSADARAAADPLLPPTIRLVGSGLRRAKRMQAESLSEPYCPTDPPSASVTDAVVPYADTEGSASAAAATRHPRKRARRQA